MAQPGLIDFSPIGELATSWDKAGERRQKSEYENLLKQAAQKGGPVNFPDLVKQAMLAGYTPGIEFASRLANAEATMRLHQASQAETARHNRAVEGQPRIVGSAEGGYYAIDKNGNLIAPGQTTPAPQPKPTEYDWNATPGKLPLPDAPPVGPGAALGGGPALAQAPGPFPLSPSDELIARAQGQGPQQEPPGPQLAGPPPPPGGGAVPPWLAGAAVPAPPGGRPAPTAPAPAPGLPPGVRPIIPGKPKEGAPVLKNDPVALTQFAAQARAGDTSVFTNLGRGAQGPENIFELRREMARQDREVPRDDHEEELRAHGVSQAIRNAEYFGLKAGQRTMGTRTANIEMAADEFKKLMPVIEQVNDAVIRTKYPTINSLVLAWKEKTGDPQVVQLGGVLNTAVNVYARAISPSGGGTVSDKEHAREILQRAWSNGQIKSALGIMGQEIDTALQAPESVRDAWRKRFREGQGLKPASEAKPPPTTAPAAEPKRTKTGVPYTIEP